MKAGFNILVDAFWGSSGKGKLAAALAERWPIEHVSSSNLPNAGHTVVLGKSAYVLKVFPSATLCLGRVLPTVWISPNSAFHMERLLSEHKTCDRPWTKIHERAIVMDEGMVADEQERKSVLKIASTCQGSGEAQVSRIRREPCIVKHKASKFRRKNAIDILNPRDWITSVHRAIANREMWLHEVSQGFALGLLYGTQYPNCTSRECSAIQAAADMGLTPDMASTGDVYLNVRSFPIRVGSTEIGDSGGWWPDTKEISLNQILHDAGVPADHYLDIQTIETTTVTKRPRRFCEMSWDWLRISAKQNGATKLALNFAQYLDWRDHRVTDMEHLSRKTRAFVDRMEDETNLPVVWVGTGRGHNDHIWLDRQRLARR